MKSRVTFDDIVLVVSIIIIEVALIVCYHFMF